VNYDVIYNNIVKGCKICNGSGTVALSNTEVKFCVCMQQYIFIIKMTELGVPLSYIFSYQKAITVNPSSSSKSLFLFQNDLVSFNVFMTLVEEGKNMVLKDSVNMFTLNNYEDLDGVMIYNLGLETFQNNSIVLYRIIKETEDRNLHGIFSFAIKKESLNNYYLDFVKRKIEERG
jgi:hypothetical protein